jgi:hypothetical protein
MNDTTRFTQADPLTLYEQMRPDQRTAIANEFVRYLALAKDPTVDEFRQPSAAEAARRSASAARGTWLVGDVAMLSAAEVARMHTYTRDNHPDIVAQVWQHPVTQASLAAPGAQPREKSLEDEPDDPGMPSIATQPENPLVVEQ